MDATEQPADICTFRGNHAVPSPATNHKPTAAPARLHSAKMNINLLHQRCVQESFCKRKKKSRANISDIFFLCLKITQNVAFDLLNFAFSTNLCPVETDLAGNTV